MNILDLVNNYSREIWDGTDKHHNECVSRLQNFAFKVGNLAVADIEAQHVYEYVTILKQQDFSVATCNRHVAAISAALRFARESGWLTNYFKIKTKKEDHRLRFFSEEELQRIEAFCKRSDVDWWFLDMCAIARYTGMRHSEVLMLSDREKSSVYEEDGAYHILLHKTKNGDAREIAVYHPDTQRAVMRISEQNNLNWYSHKVFYRQWEQMRNIIAKGDKQFVFHVFRHTAASRMANELRMNSDIIGQWLGHRNPATTSKYVHIKKDTIKSIATQLA